MGTLDLYDEHGSLSKLASKYSEQRPVEGRTLSNIFDKRLRESDKRELLPLSLIFDKSLNESDKRERLYLALHGLDWAQTRQIAKSPHETVSETNPILGRHPSVGRVNNYFLATGLGHYGLSKILPPDLAKLFQYGTIGLEAATTGRNKLKYNLGLPF